MKKILGLLLTGFIFNFAGAQDYQNDFNKFFQENDSINQLKTLTEWEKSNPKNPELFTSYFNYYFSKSKDEIIVVAAGNREADCHRGLRPIKGPDIEFVRFCLKSKINKIHIRDRKGVRAKTKTDTLPTKMVS
ncbi:hypothetical protein [Marinilabilia sp.]|uniref:hypothetical protein n=1 Tax=Marinilabilia sp. TaxID=2021252 RepID=UPI0025BD2E35|nr:hypothetical protein [Marinilabilia sp.]